MDPITLLKIKDFLARWWRETALVVLALALALCAGRGADTRKELQAERQARLTAETNLTETARALTRARAQAQAAEASALDLSVKLAKAVNTETTREPVAMPDGSVAYRERTSSTENTSSDYTERAVYEFRIQRTEELLEQSELQLSEQRRQVSELREELKELETSRPSGKHLLVAVGKQAFGTGPLADCWLAGLGARADLGFMDLGLTIKTPVLGGPASELGYADGARAWLADLTLGF